MPDGEVEPRQKTYSFPGKGFLTTWKLQDSDDWVWSARIYSQDFSDDETYLNERCAYSNALQEIEATIDEKLGKAKRV